MELLFLDPVMKETIWGGSRLADQFGYEIPSDHTGECWAISAHPNGDGKVRGGTWNGISLSTLWREHPELFGNRRETQFPLLVKIIDAREDLSIQVHPDDRYAGEHEHGSLGKTECWYILDCEADSTIIVGTNAGSQAEVEQLIAAGRYHDLIREIPIKKGDFFQIDPGCLHAIKGGTMILETQQSSDVTYRVYDYGRLSEGKLRELHVKQSIDVITAPFDAGRTQPPVTVTDLDGTVRTHYVTCPYYQVDRYEIKDCFEVDFNADFVNVSVLRGEGQLNGVKIKKGDHFIIPSGYGTCSFTGNLELICSQP